MPDQADRLSLATLFEQWSGISCTDILALGAQGSSRRYYRMLGGESNSISAIGSVGDDIRENRAFFALCRHLHARGIRVPELYAVAPDQRCYLQQDLGDLTLYGFLHEKQRQGGGFDAQMLLLYKQALADLTAIQQAGADFDFSLSYPRPDFDRQSILWDLNYFKYHFLKLAQVPFDEQLLEDDFLRLADLLLQADTHFLLYRDFNPRNIMVFGPQLFYIDFQGARRGAAQYDVASILYSAKSNLPEAIRHELLEHYLRVRGIRGEARRQWLSQFWSYLLLRILQTLGAYGYRGLFERKDYFLQSIPLALHNLRSLADDHPDLFLTLPHIKQIVLSLSDLRLQPSASVNVSFNVSAQSPQPSPLTVFVQSFSYKQGLPADPSGNGGGFIFDCRALPNPGRYPEYKAYTGKDRPVIEFLQHEPSVDHFLQHVKMLVAQSVDKYVERRFSSLQVSFGCTGGQHRSVFCAEQLAQWLRITYPNIHVALRHREQERGVRP